MSAAAILHLLNDACARGITPGGQVAWAEGDEPPTVVVAGHTAGVPQRGAPVTPATVYDIASLTKPMATAAVAMQLVAAGTLELERPLSSWLPELAAPTKRAITVAQVLGHTGGFAAHVEFFRRLRAGDWADQRTARAALRAMAAAEPLAHPPGTRSLYSDLGYILLGFALEEATGARLDELVRTHVSEPLGLRATRYIDLTAASRPDTSNWAATEHDEARGGIVCGEVHDENAHVAGGILGHAGLFSTAHEVALFGQAIVKAWAGEPGVFEPSAVAAFLDRRAAPGSSWRLGWDTPSATAGISHAGDAWSRAGVGHLAFTGCSLWLERERRRIAVILTNRVHPDRAATTLAIKELRRTLMDHIVAALDAH